MTKNKFAEAKFKIRDDVWHVFFDKNNQLSQATQYTIRAITLEEKGLSYSVYGNDGFYREEDFKTIEEFIELVNQLKSALPNK